MVTEDVLNLVSENIHGDWTDLSKELHVELSWWVYISSYFKSSKENLQNVFRMLKCKIPWNVLRHALTKINRHDIVEMIEKLSIITLGNNIKHLEWMHLTNFLAN